MEIINDIMETINDNVYEQPSAEVLLLEWRRVLCGSGDTDYTGETDDLVLDEFDDIWY